MLAMPRLRVGQFPHARSHRASRSRFEQQPAMQVLISRTAPPGQPHEAVEGKHGSDSEHGSDSGHADPSASAALPLSRDGSPPLPVSRTGPLGVPESEPESSSSLRQPKNRTKTKRRVKRMPGPYPCRETRRNFAAPASQNPPRVSGAEDPLAGRDSLHCADRDSARRPPRGLSPAPAAEPREGPRSAAANAKDRAAIVQGGARPAPSGTKDADVIGPKPLSPRPRNNGRSLKWAALMQAGSGSSRWSWTEPARPDTSVARASAPRTRSLARPRPSP